MKIAVWHNLPSGGAKRALYDQVRGLVERGHQIKCWCPSTSDRSYLPLNELVPETVVEFRWLLAAFNRRFGRLLHLYQKTVGCMAAMEGVYKRCARQIDAEGFDLLFMHGCRWHAVSSVARHVRMPSVLYLQEPYRPFYEAAPCLPWVAASRRAAGEPALRKRIERWAAAPSLRRLRRQAGAEWLNAQACNTLLVNSRYSRETVLRVYGRDAAVCYLGVDTDLFCDQDRPRARSVVGVGSFQPHKGLDFVVRALARIPAPRPALVWIGNLVSKTYFDEVRALAAALGVAFEPKVMIPDSEVVGLLNTAQALVYAPHLEPFGFAVLEAAACATPAVGVAEGGVRETIEDGLTGFLVDRDEAAFAGAVAKLLDDPALARRLGGNARRRVAEKWTWTRCIDQLEACFREVRGQRLG
ncbi:MAG: glycosyltransferase family 4 protein [Kiritimatiellae bacterium]|nr:glycosyltransferase family 4 protein [Kiritimatiellia bacterium]